MFSSPAHTQYQLKSTTENFLHLDITGLPFISSAAQKKPLKSLLCLLLSHGIPPISSTTGTSGAANICQAHFPSPARGSQSNPQLGCLYKHVYLLCQHTLESKHIKRKRKQTTRRGLSKPRPAVSQVGGESSPSQNLTLSLCLPTHPQGSDLCGQHTRA